MVGVAISCVEDYLAHIGATSSTAPDSAVSASLPAGTATDSKGRVIPRGVTRLPSGKLPSNLHYAGRTFDGPTLTPALAAKYPDGVKFTSDGFPDFAPYAVTSVTIDPNFKGNRTTDFAEANRLAGLRRTPDDYTWHHHQDTRTMQLVPEDMHDAVRHAGGVAIMKGKEPQA